MSVTAGGSGPTDANKMHADVLVIDSGALIHGENLYGRADEFYTIPEVLDELRDPRVRAMVSSLPYELKTRLPSDKDMQAVAEFSKKTGDYVHLSVVDLKVLALAHMFERERHAGTSHLNHGGRIAPKEGEPSPEEDVSAAASPKPKRKAAPAPVNKAWAAFAKAKEASPVEELKVAAPVAPVADGEDSDSSVWDTDDENTGAKYAEAKFPALGADIPDYVSSDDEGEKQRALAKKKKEANPGAWGAAGAAAPVTRTLEEISAEPLMVSQAFVRAPIQKMETSRNSMQGKTHRRLDNDAPDMDVAPSRLPDVVKEIEVFEDWGTHGNGNSRSAKRKRKGKGGRKDEKEVPDLPGWCEDADSDEDWGSTVTAGKGQNQKVLDGALADEDGDAFGGGCWITPTNISAVKTKEHGVEEGKKEVKVACTTTDYSMQNVLVHMGMSVMSVGGYSITTVKQWALRCHACGHICMNTLKKFCPECGLGETLIRVSYTVTKDKIKVYVGRGGVNKTYNLKGTKFTVPKRKGGKRNNDLNLSETEYQQALRRVGMHAQANGTFKKKATFDWADQDYDPLARKVGTRRDVRAGGNPNKARKVRRSRGKKKKSTF